MFDYPSFIKNKMQSGQMSGFDPIWIPDFLFDFQKHLVEWSIRKGRSAIFAECGMGKTPMQLTWAENVVRRTNKHVLVVTPLAVGAQTVGEASKFGISADRTRDGKMPTDSAKILVTNYGQLHKYDPTLFGGCVCDESSAIKDFKSEQKSLVTEFTRNMEYRLLCTATAAPNDFWELGTSSEVLGYTGFRDMITYFFKQETSKDIHGWGRTKYRFRGHAEQPFWKWVCGWARSLRKPSDLGFDDSKFILPPLVERETVVDSATPRDGMLYTIPATNMREEREERRHTIKERCEVVAAIATKSDEQSIHWCELNTEADALERMIPDSVQVSGSMNDEQKEEYLLGFACGQIKRLITKPKIGAWGMNFQNCHRITCFPSHSFEQYYQLVRRCYRFGQTKPVEVDIVVCEGEKGIMNSLNRKHHQANVMFDSIVKHMGDELHLQSFDRFNQKEKVPSWL